MDPASPTTLHERIIRQAEGLYAAEAAAMIITEAVHGQLVSKLAPAIVDNADSGTAFVDWHAAVELAGPFSRGERQLVVLAASLASDEISINAGDAFTALDHSNAAIVIAALAHSLGWSLTTLTGPDPFAGAAE